MAAEILSSIKPYWRFFPPYRSNKAVSHCIRISCGPGLRNDFARTMSLTSRGSIPGQYRKVASQDSIPGQHPRAADPTLLSSPSSSFRSVPPASFFLPFKLRSLPSCLELWHTSSSRLSLGFWARYSKSLEYISLFQTFSWRSIELLVIVLIRSHVSFASVVLCPWWFVFLSDGVLRLLCAGFL